MAGKYTIRSKEEKLAIDEARLIESLKKLSSYEDLEDVLDIDAVLRYFVVHNFVVNGDSYTGSFQPPSETEAPEDADAASGSPQRGAFLCQKSTAFLTVKGAGKIPAPVKVQM